MASVEEKLAKSLTAESVELIPYLPFLLQDLWDLGSWPSDIIDMIQKHVYEPKRLRILDLACGKGAVSVQIAKTLECQVKGVDIMPAFIEFAKMKAMEYGVTSLCTFEVGDINQTILEDRGYDVVILGAVGDVLGNPKDTLRKLKGTVKSGGYIIVDDAYAKDDSDYQYTSREKWQEYLKELGLILIDERFAPDEDMSDLNHDQQAHILRRANELKLMEPDKAELFDGYIRSQLAECDEIENEIMVVAMMIQVVE